MATRKPAKPTLDLTLEDIQALMPVLNAGVQAAGIQIFQNKGGARLQSILDKIEAYAQAIAPKEEDDG